MIKSKDFTKEEVKEWIENKFIFNDYQLADCIVYLLTYGILYKYGHISMGDLFEYLYNYGRFGELVGNNELLASGKLEGSLIDHTLCNITDYECYEYVLTMEDFGKIWVKQIDRYQYKIEFPDFKRSV